MQQTVEQFSSALLFNEVKIHHKITDNLSSFHVCRKRLEEAPLMTKSLRESQMKEKLERYPKVVFVHFSVPLASPDLGIQYLGIQL